MGDRRYNKDHLVTYSMFGVSKCEDKIPGSVSHIRKILNKCHLFSIQANGKKNYQLWLKRESGPKHAGYRTET